MSWHATNTVSAITIVVDRTCTVPCCYTITATTSILFCLESSLQFQLLVTGKTGEEKRILFRDLQSLNLHLIYHLLISSLSLSFSLSGGLWASTGRDRCTAQSTGEGRGEGIFHLYGTQRQRARASHTRSVSEGGSVVWCGQYWIHFMVTCMHSWSLNHMIRVRVRIFARRHSHHKQMQKDFTVSWTSYSRLDFALLHFSYLLSCHAMSYHLREGATRDWPDRARPHHSNTRERCPLKRSQGRGRHAKDCGQRRSVQPDFHLPLYYVSHTFSHYMFWVDSSNFLWLEWIGIE